MALKYPRFNTHEYNLLKPIQQVVKYWNELAKTRAELAEADEEYRSIQKNIADSDGVLCAEIEQYVSKYLAELPKTYEERLPKLSEVLCNYASLRKHASTHRGKERAIDAALQTVTIYTAFDRDAFQEDMMRLIAEREVDKNLSEKLEAAEKKFKKIQKSAETLENNWRRALPRSLPKSWRDRKMVVKGTTAEQKQCKRKFAHTILENFIHDWKTRAKSFNVPVTIYGVAIQTLPDELKKPWISAYRSLGLDKLPKRPVYQWLKSTAKRTANTEGPVFRGDNG